MGYVPTHVFLVILAICSLITIPVSFIGIYGCHCLFNLFSFMPVEEIFSFSVVFGLAVAAFASLHICLSVRV